jgi:putative copper resistance protein D
MILEYLQPDPSALDAAFVMLRAATHVAMLGAAGLALFGLGFGAMLARDDQDRLRRWMLGLALAGIALNIGALPLRVLVLTAGASAFEFATLQAVMSSRNGDAFWLRIAGLSALAVAAARPGRVADALAGAGALVVSASYAALGHSMLFRPRQELAGLVTLHLLAVGFWTGSLLPLAWAAARGQAALIEAWSRAALWAVATMAATGAALAVLLVRRGELLLAGWYGWALLAKVALVGLMLLLAARNRALLTPRMAGGGGPALARSIRVETTIALLVAWAVAELVSVHPIDAGHRI